MANISGKEMLEMIISRQSERSYYDREVEKDKLDRILEAGRMSPSACNSQPWKFIVINEPVLKKKVAEAASTKELGINKFVDQVPVLIVIIREKPNLVSQAGGALKRKDYSIIDIGIAAENICLQAVSEGLGTCMLGWFNERKVKELLGVPESKRALLIITLGYPSKPHRPKRRKNTEEVVSYNRY
jgi:nitroreductase